jgi:tRNA nucleotidyltransferase/poly(A) polymerase
VTSDGPPFAVEPEVVAVLETLWRNGQAAYLVGGAVRDALLGLPGSDWDVATDARPEHILRIFPGGTYENRFGTVKARGLEITTFRREHRYADHRRPDSVTFSDDIYEDLSRRDLTINAIAWGRRGDGTPARLVDPADGQGDLRARLVRAVGDPGRRFDEDALRLLRAVRIAARLDFTIEPITRAALMAHAGDVAWVSEERVGDEVRRMLAMDRPSKAIRSLRETGLLATTLPELEERLRREGAAGEGLFARGLVVLDAVASQGPGGERLRWAALLGETTTAEARSALERLRVAGRERDAICLLIARAAVDAGADWSDADVRRFMGSLPPESLDDLLALRHARASAAGAEQVAREAEWQARVLDQRLAGVALVIGDLAIDGRDLQATLGIPEGPTVGRILERLLADVIEDPGLNRRMPLLTRAGLVLDELMHGNVDGPDRPNVE